MKVKVNNKWEKINPFSLDDFGNYTILTPEMVSGTVGTSSQRYIGTATHLIIDDSFPTNSLSTLFRDNLTLKSLVILTDKFTNMSNTFYNIGSQFESLFTNTSKVTTMGTMFRNYKATSLDLSSFDTSNVLEMSNMFNNSQATSLDLSSFDTSKVLSMGSMFYNSKVTTLDLSSFDTSNEPNMASMFRFSRVTTGYARTQADADRFNASSYKPEALNFIVKP